MKLLKISLDLNNRGGDLSCSYIFPVDRWEPIKVRLEAMEEDDSIHLGEVLGKHSSVSITVGTFLKNINVEDFVVTEGWQGGNVDVLGTLADSLIDDGAEPLPY